MADKKCSKCQEYKDVSCFYKNKNKKDGYGYYCKECFKEYRKKWAKKNRDKVNGYRKNWADRNKDKIEEYGKYQYEKNKEKWMKRIRKWQEQNPEKVYQYKKIDRERNGRERARKNQRKRLSFPKGRIDHSISSAIHKTIGAKKAGRKWEELVGYSVEDLMNHLEKQFDENMTWENYGSYWHIDHIIPKCYFKYDTPEDEEFKKCWSLENLQPLEAKQNFIKNNKLQWQA